MSEWTKEYTKFRKEITNLNESELRKLLEELASLEDKYSKRKHQLVTHEIIRRFPSDDLEKLFEEWKQEAKEDAKNELDYGQD